MSSSRRYKDLANHLRNTLGLTRELVLDYAREVVREEVRRWLDHHYPTIEVRNIVARWAERFFREQGERVMREVLKEWSVELEETTRRLAARKGEER